jgi:hypothetical protein
MKVAVALSLTAGSIGPLDGAVKGLNKVHEALKAELASGRLTDKEYAKKCRQLLNLTGSFDDLIEEVAKDTSQR